MLALSLPCAGMGRQPGQWGATAWEREGLKLPLQVPQPGLSVSSWKVPAAGSWTLVLAQGRPVCSDGGPKAWNLEQLCWHTGTGGMDGKSGQDLADQALDLDNQVGAGVLGRVQNAMCPADTSVWLLASPYKPQ